VTVARPPEAAPLPPPAAGEARPVTLVVESNPPGAQMTLNEQPRGVTPCVVRDLAPGRHMLKLSLDGYEDLVRQIYNPGMLPEEPYELHLKAGVVRIVSTPPGAVVVHGSQILGITPLIVRDLPAGRQELRVFAHGYEPRVVEVATSAVRGDTLNVELASLLGDLEVITIPAGCAVWVDRTEKGRTVRQEDGRNQSQPLRIGGLREGEHELRIVHPNGAEKVETVTVRRGQAATSVARLWVLDTKLVLNDGTTRHGMLVQVNEFGDVILAEPRPNRYLKEQVAEVRPLTPDEARALQGGRNAPDEAPPAPEAKPPAPAPGTPPDDGLAPELLPPRDTGAEAAPPEQPMLLAADELTQTLRRETVTNVGRRFNGKAVTVTGTPTATRSNEIRATVSLGPSIQCEIDRAHYEEVKERIRNAQEKTQALSFAGRAITHGQNLILRECRVTEPPANEEGQR